MADEYSEAKYQESQGLPGPYIMSTKPILFCPECGSPAEFTVETVIVHYPIVAVGDGWDYSGEESRVLDETARVDEFVTVGHGHPYDGIHQWESKPNGEL